MFPVFAISFVQQLLILVFLVHQMYSSVSKPLLVNF